MKAVRNRLIFILYLLALTYKAIGADEKYLSKNELISIIRQYHPVVKQADFTMQRAKAQLLQSRGNFDPVLMGEVGRKSLDGKVYYNYFNTQITIPTWYGLDIKAGIEEVSGDRVSPEATLGKTSYIGVKLSTNNLLFDARRATLAQAKLFYRQTESEKQLAANNVIFDALVAYWNWVKEYQNYTIITKAIQVNEERLQFVRVEFEQGARPAIDTTETLSQLQAFYVQQQAALLAYINAGIELSGFMWLEGNYPYQWDDSIVPDSNDLYTEYDIPALSKLLDAVDNHPKLASVSYKIGSLKIDQKLKSQYFIPKLSINANMLGKGYYEQFSLSSTQLENNHKLGISLNMPLLYRDAIGGYKASKLKVLEMQAEQNNLILQLEIKVKMYYNEVLSLKNQIETYTKAYENFQRLFLGEKFRFDNGESSLFVLNSRENKVLEASQKLVELKTKWHKSYAALLWASGQLN
ncbi:MAG: TolC family protein [Bacteroidetes bacterium]|nr:TolC family protein [Bacteroidota bacterium]